MGAVGAFIKARVCPYCFVVVKEGKGKGLIERDHHHRPVYRRFDGRRRLTRHLRKQHPNSLAAKEVVE